MRVAQNEFRVFPLVSMGAVAYPRLDPLLEPLCDEGVVAEVVDVACEFQVGGNQMLVGKHRSR